MIINSAKMFETHSPTQIAQFLSESITLPFPPSHPSNTAFVYAELPRNDIPPLQPVIVEYDSPTCWLLKMYRVGCATKQKPEIMKALEPEPGKLSM